MRQRNQLKLDLQNFPGRLLSLRSRVGSTFEKTYTNTRFAWQESGARCCWSIALFSGHRYGRGKKFYEILEEE